MPATLVVHNEDPADKICELAGNLDDVSVYNNKVLVGIYKRGDESGEYMTPGGVIVTEKTTKEDQYQSKVGLLLRMGPSAFHDESGKWFDGQDMTVGDWVVFRPSDGTPITLVSKNKKGLKQELLCRMLEDTAIMAKSSSPDRVY